MCSVLRKSWHIRFFFSGFTTDSFCTTPTLQYIVHLYRTVNQFESSYIYFWHSLVLSIGFITVFYDFDLVQYYVPRSYTTVLYAHKMRNYLAYSDILVESTLCSMHQLIKNFTNTKAIPSLTAYLIRLPRYPGSIIFLNKWVLLFRLFGYMSSEALIMWLVCLPLPCLSLSQRDTSHIHLTQIIVKIFATKSI